VLHRILRHGTRRLAVHTEDEARLRERKALVEASGDVCQHHHWRDVESALKATQRIVRLAAETGRRLHVLHVTTAEEMAFLAQHKRRVTVETKATPQATTATPSKAATTTDLVNTSERETASATASAAQVTTVQTSAVTVANPWTIQLITYVGQVKANEEVKKLKAKGWDAFVIPSGKYAQLCVGKFNTKNEAERFMSEVRGLKTYSGAYVRRVKR
jgi:cell division septation protein DedD